jgi:hypothetical protein
MTDRLAAAYRALFELSRLEHAGQPQHEDVTIAYDELREAEAEVSPVVRDQVYEATRDAYRMKTGRDHITGKMLRATPARRTT